MNSTPAELLYALLIAAVLLVQYLMKRFGGRPQLDDALQEAPIAHAPPAEREAPVPARWAALEEVPAVSFAAAEGTARLAASAANAAMSRQRAVARSLLNGGPDLRRAIACMTLLGPCRAQVPHESQ